MVDYGDPALVKKMIRATEAHEPGTDVNDRIAILNAAISRLFEDACEREWGVVVADTTEVAWVGPRDTIILSRPARTITSVRHGGVMSGTTMTGGTVTLAADLYYPITDRNGLIYAITLKSGGLWERDGSASGGAYNDLYPVVITGDFVTSDNDTTVPDDIKYAVSYAIAERLKVEKASSGVGGIGPDGTTVPLNDVFQDAIVKRTINKYKRELLMMVV
jgi:hypothetical protein